jgi:aspartate carbamoyltransferase regulatory subunit
MPKEKKLMVNAIKDGTVIDHIPAKHLFKVISILGLDKIKTTITFGTNLESDKLGKKAIIKISEVFFEDQDINKIALITQEAQLNIIKNYEVVEKKPVRIPDFVVGIAKCVNPKCITNNENMLTRFTIVDKKDIALKCEYCEKITDKEHIKILKN